MVAQQSQLGAKEKEFSVSDTDTVTATENRRASFQKRRTSFSNTRHRRMSAEKRELEKLTLESVEGLMVVDGHFEDATSAEMKPSNVYENGSDEDDDADPKKVLEPWQPWECEFCKGKMKYQFGFSTCPNCDAVYHVRAGGFSG
jgi:hypothetical protein